MGCNCTFSSKKTPNHCGLLNIDTGKLDVCPYATEAVTAAEKFLKEYLPVDYMRYISYIGRAGFPEIGDTLIYIGNDVDYIGKEFIVSSINDMHAICIHEDKEFLVDLHVWWLSFFSFKKANLQITVSDSMSLTNE